MPGVTSDLVNFAKRALLSGVLLVASLGTLYAQTTYFSRASAAWNVNSTWSTVGFGSSTNTGTFPVAGDIVNVGGGFTVSVPANAACATITIDNGSGLAIGAASFTVSGTTTVGGGSSGTLSITSATGTKLFAGLVTINSGATWINTNEGVTFQGGITNNGTFTAGTGSYLFNTNSQALNGTLIIARVAVSGTTVVLTNNNSLSVNTVLSGTGRLTQGAGAVLNIGGTSTITNMTATAAGNSVNYTGSSQTVHNNSYVNLGLSGSGTKTLQAGTTSISGDLTLSGTASTTGVTGLTLGGTVTIGSGTSFTAGTFGHSVGGNWINDGTFIHSGSTLTFTGAAQSIGGTQSTNFNEVVLGGTGTKVFGIATFIAGKLYINSGVKADLGSITTHTANSLILGGALQTTGTWGSTGSTATNKNNTYFLITSSGRIAIATGGNTYYSRATGPWNSSSTWSTVDHGSATNIGTFPTAGDYAVIGGSNFIVTVTANAASKALSFDAGTSVTNTLTINSGTTLTVSDGVTIPQTLTSGSNILDAGAGNLIASSISFTNGSTGGTGHQITISTGTVTVSGNVSGTGTSSKIVFSNAGLLQLGGSFYTSLNGTLTVVSGSTVEYNGGLEQTVEAHAYDNLTLSGNNTKTLAIGTTTVSGNLTIGDNTTFSVGASSLTVNGTTTVGGGSSGTLSITSANGTKIFAGLLTINSGAIWINTSEGVTFRGGIINNGTFTAGTGTHIFNTNSQSLTGTFIIPKMTVTGATVVVTNNNTLTVNTALSGSGRIMQGPGAVLNIGGTSAITNMTASAGGNTVNYTGASQTVHNNAYGNLGLSGSGTKTLQAGTTSISGDLNLSGTVSTTGITALAISGSVAIGSGTSFTAGAFSHSVGGDWTNDGAFTHSNSTITFTGAAQTIGGTQSTDFNEVVLGGTGTKVFGIATFIAGKLSINSGVKADLGSITTHTANSLVLGGALQLASGTWGSTGSGATNKNNTYFLFSSSGQITIATGGNTYYSRASGAWNSSSTWSTVGHGSSTNTGTFPTAGDFAIIGGTNFTVTVTVDAESKALSFDAGTSVTNTLTINSGTTLTVFEDVTIPQTITSGSNVLDAGAGNLIASNINFTNGSVGGTGHQLTISTGTVTVSGNVSGTGTSSKIAFSNTGLLQLGGSFYTPTNGTLTVVAGSTVEYNGGLAQTVEAHTYNKLTLSGSGTKSLALGTTTVGGNLLIEDNTTFLVDAASLTVNGTTAVGGGNSGTLSFTSSGGTKIFAGQVTVNSGATWSNTSEGVTFRGGIINNGTFTAGTGLHNFTTNSQALTGTFSMQSVSVVGASVVLTNNNTLTVSGSLSGNGRLTQGTGAVLNIGGTSTITNMTATASGNTVNYTGAAQTVHSNPYVNLGLSGSGTKTLQVGTSAITGNFSLTGSISTTGVTDMTIGGWVNIGSGTTFTAGAFSHSVAGDWTNDGNFVHSSDTITFNGTAIQNIQGTSATTFNGVNISNTSAFVRVESNQNLAGTLTLAASAKFDADGSNNTSTFTLLSTGDSPAIDAAIAELPGTAQFIGNVTVQRFFSPKDNFDRFISSPVANGTVLQIQTSTPLGSFPVTGNFAGSSYPCTGCNNNGHNLRYYREAATGQINSGYKNWIIDSTSTLVPGVGYDAFMWNGVSNTTVSFRGTINRGSYNLGVVTGPPSNSITHTSNGVATADGWNLVGNPYPSSIQWNNGAGWNRTNIDPTVWVWDVVGRVWHSYNADTFVGDLTNGIIASGQGFWVYAPAVGGGSITINEQAKSTSGPGSYYRKSKPLASLKISLGYQEIVDNAFLILNENATDEVDAGLDAPKMQLGIERMSVSFLDKNENKLAHYALSENPDKDLPISVSADTEGDYTLSFSSINGFESFENYYLIDSHVGTSSKISEGPYQFTITSNPETFNNRFRLSLNPLTRGSSEFQVKLNCYPNPTSGSLTVEINSDQVQGILLLDNMGRVMRNVPFQSHRGITLGEVDMMNYSNGVYFMKVVSEGKLIVEKIVKY